MAAVLIGALVLLGAGWILVPRLSWSSDEEGPMMYDVGRADFVHDVTEKGSVESASNVDVRCEVQTMRTAGTMILEIVPEGTYVEKGDFLVRLDSSALEADRIKLQMACAQSLAAVTEAQNTLETAKANRDEYLDGQYKLSEQKLESQRLVAKQGDSRAKENLVYSERLAAKGYITKLQLDAERFAVKKAENELNSAELELKVLQDYTKPKQIKQLESAIKTAEAQLEARQHSHEIDAENLRRIEEQIQKCVMTAPEAGEVVYANVTDNRGGSETIIEEGVLVREHQVIVRLPDPKRMQVKAKINEARISLVRRGMRSAIRLDAFPDLELTGEVDAVGDYPAPASWFRGDVKEYETLIRIDTPPPGLKPGLTAQVRIRVEDLDQVLQAPVQAIVESRGRHYCVVRNGETWEPREVQLGPSNDKTVVICDVADVPVPALFEFEGRPFALVSSGPRWESRVAEVAADEGEFCAVRLGGSGESVRVQAVFDVDGKPVRLVYDGVQWSVRPLKADPKTRRLLPVPDARPVPVQAVFDLDGRHFSVESDSQQWIETRDRFQPKSDREPLMADAPTEEKTPPVDPGDASPTPTDKGAPGKGTKPRAAKALAAPVVTWTAREVAIGSDPENPGGIGVGLKSGEQVVLNAAAYRDKVMLPETSDDVKTRGRPRGPKSVAQPKSRPEGKKSKDSKKRDSESPIQSFRNLDRNNDKMLTKDELPATLQARFDEFDRDRDGGLDMPEWALAMSGYRPKEGADADPKKK